MDWNGVVEDVCGCFLGVATAAIARHCHCRSHRSPIPYVHPDRENSPGSNARQAAVATHSHERIAAKQRTGTLEAKHSRQESTAEVGRHIGAVEQCEATVTASCNEV